MRGAEFRSPRCVGTIDDFYRPFADALQSLAQFIAGKGFITASSEGREELASRPISSGCDSLAPPVQRRGAQGAMRSGRREMAVGVESVVDGGVG